MTEAEFIKYVRSFYGSRGIYAEFFATNPPGPNDYQAAFRTLLSLRAEQGVPFEGDSYDREVMRDILFVRMGIIKANETEYQVEV